MKKLLTLTITAILCFGLTSNLFAALDADTVWEVRTTGADTNGGGFNSTNASAGTDYSQQDSAQLALTDLAMTTGGTTLTSATGGFTEAMEGNIIQIISGTNFTAGFYEIVTYTDTNTVTIDRDATNGSNASSGVGNVGGGLASPDKASLAVVSRNIVYIQAGTYQPIGANAYVLLTQTTYVRWIGYNSSRGDCPVGANMPLLDGNSSATNVLDINFVERNIFEYLRFANATQDNILDMSNTLLYRCKVYSAGRYGIYISVARHIGMITKTEIYSNGNDGLRGNIQSCQLSYSYLHDNTDDGLEGDRGDYGWIVYKNIFDSNGGKGTNDLQVDYTYLNGIISSNVAYNNTGDGFEFSGNATANPALVTNNISKDNGGYGFNVSTASMSNGWIFDNNCYHNNSSGSLNNVTAGSNDVTSDPSFTNAAAGDFTVQSGSPVLDAGFQLGTDVGLTGDYTENIGPDQDDNAAGGSSEHSYGFVN